MNTIFKKTLLDLVKGLRSHKGDEASFINKCLAEIKDEVRESDHDVKANAIQKLCFLYMNGYDISFAHFPIVEVMSQPSFQHRRTAYLAASLTFTDDTDVILLTPHLFKKAFSISAAGGDPRLMEGLFFETGCALNCLGNICTPYLAEVLLEDVYGMMNSARPYIRKKAVLILYPIFRKYPRALRLSFDRLKSKLKDDDAGVQNAAVNVICELARKNPSNYLSLLPLLFELLNNSNNNWMLIKLVKLLGSLIPAEPRLARKLHDPLTHIISNTPAKSLLYECINTATHSEVMSKSMVRLCLEKLRTFVEDVDQNLKYLGLLGLNKIMKQSPKSVAQHKDLILQCLDDPDVTIRMRALDLITSMVTSRNLEAIIQRLTDHLYGTDGSYRNHVLEQIIQVCAKEDYEYISDFAWYVELLTNMTHLSSMSLRNAELIAAQLIDVAIRVPDVRDFAVSQMEGLIIKNGLIGDAHNMSVNAICRVLRAAAYIVGEFAETVDDHLTLVRAMLQSRISSLPGDIQCLFVHNALKVVCAGLAEYLSQDEDEDDEDEDDEDGDDAENGNKKRDKLSSRCQDLIDGTIQLLEPLAGSQFIEVQERATAYLYFMRWLGPHMTGTPDEQSEMIDSFSQVFEVELQPVHEKHQAIMAKKIPSGLKLDRWIGEPWPETSDDEDDDDSLVNISDVSKADSWMLGSGPEDNDIDGEAGDVTEWNNRKGKSSKKKKKYVKKRSDDPYMLDSLGETQDKWKGLDKDRVSLEDTKDGVDTDKIETKIFPNKTLGMGVMPKRGQRDRKHGRKKGRKGKRGKRSAVTKITKLEDEEKFNVVTSKSAYVDPLAAAFDLNANCEDEMPHLKRYEQARPTLIGSSGDKKGDPSANPDDSKKSDENPDKKSKKSRKKSRKEKKDKKDKKKGASKEKKDKKKGGKKDKDKKKSKDKKEKKKGKTKKDSKKNEKAEIPEQRVAEDTLLDMFDFGGGPSNGMAGEAAAASVTVDDGMPQPNGTSSKKSKKDKKSKKKKKSSKKKKANATSTEKPTDDLGLFEMFGDPLGSTETPTTSTSTATTAVDVKTDETSDNDDNESELLAHAKRQILVDQDDLKIEYTVNGGENEKTIEILFDVSWNGDSPIKSLKIQMTPPKGIKLSKKDAKSITLAKSMESGGNIIQSKVILKVSKYVGSDQIRCKGVYTKTNNDGSKIKLNDLSVNIPSYGYCLDPVMNGNGPTSEEDLTQLIGAGDSDHFSESMTGKFKTKKYPEILEILASVWRLRELSRSDKKRVWYAYLVGQKHLAIFAKIKSKGGGIQLTVNTFSKELTESVMDDLKRVLERERQERERVNE